MESNNLTLARHSDCQLATASAASRSFFISSVAKTSAGLCLRRDLRPPAHGVSLPLARMVYQHRDRLATEFAAGSEIGLDLCRAWSHGPPSPVSRQCGLRRFLYPGQCGADSELGLEAAKFADFQRRYPVRSGRAFELGLDAAKFADFQGSLSFYC